MQEKRSKKSKKEKDRQTQVTCVQPCNKKKQKSKKGKRKEKSKLNLCPARQQKQIRHQIFNILLGDRLLQVFVVVAIVYFWQIGSFSNFHLEGAAVWTPDSGAHLFFCLSNPAESVSRVNSNCLSFRTGLAIEETLPSI